MGCALANKSLNKLQKDVYFQCFSRPAALMIAGISYYEKFPAAKVCRTREAGFFMPLTMG
jgi:hypothetical protein